MSDRRSFRLRLQVIRRLGLEMNRRRLIEMFALTTAGLYVPKVSYFFFGDSSKPTDIIDPPLVLGDFDWDSARFIHPAFEKTLLRNLRQERALLEEEYSPRVVWQAHPEVVRICNSLGTTPGEVVHGPGMFYGNGRDYMA